MRRRFNMCVKTKKMRCEVGETLTLEKLSQNGASVLSSTGAHRDRAVSESRARLNRIKEVMRHCKPRPLLYKSHYGEGLAHEYLYGRCFKKKKAFSMQKTQWMYIVILKTVSYELCQ